VSDETTPEMEREDLAIQRALATLTAGTPGSAGPIEVDEDPTARDLERQYTELLGLIPFELEPVEPSPEALGRLLERIRSEPGSTAATSPDVAATGRVAQMPAPTAAKPRTAPWLMPLAAVLALLMIGGSLLFTMQLRNQNETIVALVGQLDSANSKINAMADLQSRLALVSQPGVEICALRPTGADPRNSGARAAMYVAPDHSEWYLVVEGLAPPPAGHSYQVWFVSAEGPVSGGIIEAGSGQRAELASNRMPSETNGIFITLERQGGQSQPTGARILFGDEVMQVL